MRLSAVADHMGGAPAARGHLAMLTFAIAISGSFSVGARAVAHIAPEALQSVRFAFALAAMMGAAAIAGQLTVRETRAVWRHLLLGFLMATYFTTMFIALKLSPPVSLSAVFTLTPLLAAGFTLALLGQGASLRVMAALAVGGIGAIWVIFRADLDAILAFSVGRGELIFFFGCAAHALYPVILRKFKRAEERDLPFAVLTVGACFLWLTVYALGTGSMGATDWGALPPIVWIAAIYLGVVTGAGTFFMVLYAAARLPAAKVMAYGYLVPTLVILWEGLSGAGWVSLSVMTGVAATIAALLMLLRA